ncbi:MAG: NAD(P)-dependent oxidoreductase [Parvibaculum sp.]
MKIALTGANGFIGRHVLQQAEEEGCEIIAMTRRNDASDTHQITWCHCDLVSSPQEFLDEFIDGCDVVIHTAGEITNIPLMHDLHVKGTRKLISSAKGRVQHWVQLSSCGVYGPVRSGVVREDHPLAPVGCYEETKELSERLVLQAAEQGYFSATVLRPSIVYGADMPNNSLRSLITMIVHGLFFYIGPAGATYNCIHVDDVARAIVSSAVGTHSQREVFNLSNRHTIEELVSIINKLTGTTSANLRVPEYLAHVLANSLGRLPGFPLPPSRVDALSSRASYSDALIRSETGWAPERSLEAGLQSLVQQMGILK